MSEFLSSRVLYSSPRVTVGDVRCRCGKCGRAGEEVSSRHAIALPRKGVFVKHLGRETVTADAMTAVYFRAGREYRVSHPTEGGDDCTTVAPSPELLAEIVQGMAPRADPAAPFSFAAGPVSAPAFAAQSRLFRSLSFGAMSEIEVEEHVFDLIGELLVAAFASVHAVRNGRRAQSTFAVHRETAEAAKAALANASGGRVDLGGIARAVHSSPYHLSRLFRAQTGTTMSRYLLRLRVRRAMTMLAEGEKDLTRAALAAGFFDHSHLTNAFRREFGVVPNTFRAAI